MEIQNRYFSKSLLLSTFAIGIFLTTTMAISTTAHHAFGAEFDPNRPVLLTGRSRARRMGQPSHMDPHGNHQ